MPSTILITLQIEKHLMVALHDSTTKWHYGSYLNFIEEEIEEQRVSMCYIRNWHLTLLTSPRNR